MGNVFKLLENVSVIQVVWAKNARFLNLIVEVKNFLVVVMGLVNRMDNALVILVL